MTAKTVEEATQADIDRIGTRRFAREIASQAMRFPKMRQAARDLRSLLDLEHQAFMGSMNSEGESARQYFREVHESTLPTIEDEAMALDRRIAQKEGERA